MTDEKKSGRPTHTAYMVRDFKKGEGEKDSSWTALGSAWSHKDGKGFDLRFDAVPLSGRVVLRENDAKRSKAD